MTDAPRRQDPAARREAILAAARRAFAEQPYDRVSVAAVAREVGVSEALVHKYFAGKPGLHADVVRALADELFGRQRDAVDALPPGTPVRDAVRVSLLTYLDHVAADPSAWAAVTQGTAGDPALTRAVREEIRHRYAAALDDLLPARAAGVGSVRRRVAVRGYLTFVDGACLDWVRQGCPADERHTVVDACLGALEGALGDWG